MDVSLHRTPGRRAPASGAAESWFLQRGLPSVLTRRARWRRLWPRSAPTLAAYAMLQICVLGIYLVVGDGHIEITGQPSTEEWVILTIVGLALPLMAVVGWLVSRLPSTRTRAGVATAAVAVVVCVGVITSGPTQLATEAAVIAALLILTGCGVGAVIGWATRMMLSHLATVGALMVRALPVVLLTALVFFNTYVWLMAATINGIRLVLAMTFLATIASAFVISATVERVRPMLHSTEVPPTERLAATPFAGMPDTPAVPPLKKAERLNVVFVLAASQLVQITVVAVVTAVIYLVLGLIILSPALLNEWTHTYVSTSTVLGWTLPVSDSLIHMCLFLSALTFMYISARAAGDSEYRSTFLDPLIDDLHTTLVARNRYRSSIAADRTARREATDLAGKRYGEVLLVEVGESGPRATVYNSFPLNDCPAELWSALDPQTIAAEHGAAAALLNGPRYWLMNRIEKQPQGPQETKTFGGIEMIEQATVAMSSMNPPPYTVNEVSRNTVFVFNAGEEVYELIDPEGRRWVMQTYSQVADPDLSRADLPGLAGRLDLPVGWAYRARVLTSELRVDTRTEPARVLQDNLTNSYSLETT